MSVPVARTHEPTDEATYSKVTWRLMPFLFLCYILAYVDRVNVGFAKLLMQQDLGMTEAVYGAGAGIFFIGYFFFEVPANMMMRKLGARRWLGPIMIVWGVMSALTMFSRGAVSFYALRFCLGIVESGFFPGVILYLTYWYTGKHRAKMVAAFMAAVPLSSVCAGPVSGWILKSLGGVGHLAAWQWLFLVEGIPSLLIGVATLYFLPDGPMKAKWLTPPERKIILDRLAEEEAAKATTGVAGHTMADAFRSPAVWWMCLVYFGIVMGNYGLVFWLPQLIKDTLTKDPLMIGWVSVLPWGASTVAMIWAGHHSDKTGERRWHIALACMLGAVAFAASGIPGISGPLGLVALTFAAMGIETGIALFWSLPTGLLSGAAAAAGIAWINSVGNLAGYVSPHVVGIIRDKTHSTAPALFMLSGAALISALATLYVTRRHRPR
jgi:sugar phosphate permease